MSPATLAFLWAPIVGAIFGAIAMIPFVPTPHGNVAFFILFAAVGSTVAIVLTLVLGLPTVLFLENKNALTLPKLLLASAIAATFGLAGFQLALVGGNQSWPPPPLWPSAEVLVFAYVCGLVTAATLWFARSRGRNAA